MFDIQILRAVAIILVLMRHLSFIPPLLALFPNKITMPFYAGVDLFSVISGFVVTRALFAGSIRPGAFVVKRLFRLLPAMFVFILFSWAIVHLARSIALNNSFIETFRVDESSFWRQALSIVFGYFIDTGAAASYYNGAMWSLSVEFQFYAAIAIVASILVLAQISAINQAHAIFAIAALFLALTFAGRTSEMLGHAQWLKFFAPVSYIMVYPFDFMAAAVILALAPKIIFRMTARPSLEGFARPLTLILFSMLVALASMGQAFRGKRGALYKSFLWLGERSYSIYLLHFPIMALVWILSVKWLPAELTAGPYRYGVSQLILVLLFLLPLSDLVFRCVEEPMRRLGAGLAAPWGAKGAPSPSAAEAG